MMEFQQMECTKRMLSAAVYGLWQNHGPALWGSLVVQLISNAQTLADLVQQRRGWQLFAQPKSNVVCFRSTRWDNADLRKELMKPWIFLYRQDPFFRADVVALYAAKSPADVRRFGRIARCIGRSWPDPEGLEGKQGCQRSLNCES